MCTQQRTPPHPVLNAVLSLALVFFGCRHPAPVAVSTGHDGGAATDDELLDPTNYPDCPPDLFGEGTLGIVERDGGSEFCRGRSPSRVGDFPPHAQERLPKGR